MTSLVKKIDAATVDHSKQRMGSFVVFCNDDKDTLEKELKALAKKEKINNTVLAIDNKAGPPGYNIAKDADVTVVLYTRLTVKANYAFKKGELKDADIKSIMKDVEKMVSAEKPSKKKDK